MNNPLLEILRDAIGAANVLTDDASCRLYSQDVFTRDQPAAAVIRPGSTAELSACVKAAVAAGVALVPRGGGMSYTSGYVPATADAVIVDMRRMDRVLEINREDMYVTVEAGCTWNTLHQALAETGLRTPYWGTLSGLYATVGGGLSQNSVFWGSGRYGTAVDSVLALEVVLADGSVLHTGGGTRPQGQPFMRNYGPDLTGLFLADTGALGFKTRATLRLLPEFTARRYLTFAADSADAMMSFMSEVSRRQLATEVFGFDPFLQEQRLKRESLAKDVKALAGVMKSAGGFGKALKEGVQVVMAGRRFLKDAGFSAHLIVEESCEAAAEDAQSRIRQLAGPLGLKELENSIPKILRANPFGPVNSMIGPNAERWVPVHGLLPHSKAKPAYEALEAVLERHKADIERFDIGIGYLFTTVSASTLLIEPVFFWPDSLNELHHHAVERGHLEKLKGFPENPEARAAVTRIRTDMIAAFDQFGAVHLQIGKAYPYQPTLQAEAWQLLTRIKALLDPAQLINPGSLGLGIPGGHSE